MRKEKTTTKGKDGHRVPNCPPETESAKEDNTEPQILKCPKCNGNLVLRTATRGANAGNQFYGCSNYPKCKYIQDLTNKMTESAQ